MRYPGATWHPVTNFTAGGIANPTLGLVLHVQAGNGEPFGWFSNPASQASSHFWVAKTGAVVQFVDTADRAWAQAAGNVDYLSVETEGLPSEPLSSAQVRSLAALFAWGSGAFGWPVALAEKPGQPGLGWHGMGGTAWGNHPGCPGDLRRAQRAAVLSLVPTSSTTTSGVFMAGLTDSQQTEIYEWIRRMSFGLDSGTPTPFSQRGEIVARIRSIQAGLPNAEAIAAAVLASVKPFLGAGTDPAAIEKAIVDALTAHPLVPQQ